MKKTQNVSLLRPPKQRQQKQTVSVQKITAKDERKIIGGLLMIGGVVLILIGLGLSYNEWTTLPIEKLALMAIVEGLGLGISTTFAGFILFRIGLAIYFAKNNTQVWNRTKKLLSF